MPNIEKNTLLFEQGDHLDGYYVIVRGTVKIEQKATKYMNRPDMPPIVIRTCYDGDYFGEISVIYDSVRSATVKCTNYCTMGKIDLETLYNLCVNYQFFR